MTILDRLVAGIQGLAACVAVLCALALILGRRRR